MSDEILPYYSRELAYVRNLGAEFARAHPKIAGRLRLGTDSVDDPHVARLIESVAFLNARIRRKLDDDFPELTHALLSTLYPHYLAPVPSMAILQFNGQSDLTVGHEIASGARLETDPVDGEPCRFRTCYDTTVWPIEIESAQLTGRPLIAPKVPTATGAVASIRLVLKCLSDDMTFAELSPESLRFYLRGQAQHVYELYELIMNNTVGVALAQSPDDANFDFLRSTVVQPVGFERDQGMLPYRAGSFPGYRLLTEFFTFPQKFLFFDLTRLRGAALAGSGNRLEVFLYLNRTSPALEQNLSRDSFALGCTPIVNLFRQRAEPIDLNQTASEYRVVPDARRPLATEVYTIDRVAATSPDGEERAFSPFYSVKHASQEDVRQRFWYAVRRPAAQVGNRRLPGTEVFLNLVDLEFDAGAPADWTMDVETTCLNRDLPGRLPFGPGEPRLSLSAGDATVESIECLTAPTPTLRTTLGHGYLWRLVSHLSLNHLSLTGGEAGTEALREILRLYDFRDSPETRALIEGVVGVRSERVAGRVASRRHGGICRGLEIEIEFDASRFMGSGLFLFASVLERFLALYCNINSFTRMVAKIKGREGELRRWAPRAADNVLV